MLKKNIEINSEEGFSLVEILVAITITSLLIGFAFGAYLFGQRLFIGWQNDIGLQNELHTIANSLSEEVFRADRIINIEGQKLVLQQPDGNKRHYEVKENMLLRNDKNILKESITLAAFKVSAQTRKEERAAAFKTDAVGNITLIELALALSNGEDTLSTARSVHLRKPSNWHSPSNE